MSISGQGAQGGHKDSSSNVDVRVFLDALAAQVRQLGVGWAVIAEAPLWLVPDPLPDTHP